MEEEKQAAEWLVFLGKVLRKIDSKMESENKNPIARKFLGKEDMKLIDVVRIITTISQRYTIYLDENERKELIFTQPFPISNIIEGLKKLEKEKQINLCISYGYFKGEENERSR